MFDYIFRGQDRGWAVIVADPHSDSSPKTHLKKLWENVMAALPFTQLLIVAHSAGAYLSMELPESNPEILERIAALVLTDGAFAPPTGEAAKILQVSRNFVASDEPAGTLLGAPPDVCCVFASAGHKDHPSTTH